MGSWIKKELGELEGSQNETRIKEEPKEAKKKLGTKYKGEERSMKEEEQIERDKMRAEWEEAVGKSRKKAMERNEHKKQKKQQKREK